MKTIWGILLFPKYVLCLGGGLFDAIRCGLALGRHLGEGLLITCSAR